MKEKAPDDPRLLMVQTAFLGDVALATPLLAALRQRFPESHLAFLGTPAGAGLIEGFPGVDEFISYDKRGREKGLAGLKQKARELADRKFDVAVSAHRSARTAVLLYLAGIERRIGFGPSALPWLYHDLVPWDPWTHEIERDLGLMGPLGGPPEDFDARPRMPEFEPAGEDLLGPADGGPKVGICPGSVWPTKRWSARGFAAVADMLGENFGASVYLIGSADDVEVAAEVESAASAEMVNLTGKTGLREWTCAIKAMDLVITNDSAPTHIAGALDVPVVVVYGPTTPGQGFAPRGGKGKVVEISGLDCRPCGKHGAKRCPEGHMKCMELIRPDYVEAAARSLLSEDG